MLNNIREQSAEIDKLKQEIKDLMQLLDAASRRERERSGGSFDSAFQAISSSSPGSLEAHTPASLMLSASTSEAGGDIGSPGEIGLGNGVNAAARPDVADWIAKAKERAEAMWGIVDHAVSGGAALFGEEDDEEDEEDDFVYEVGEEYEEDVNKSTNDEDDFAVIDVEPPDGVTSDEDRADRKSIRTLSNSSNSPSRHNTSKQRKISAQHLTPLPNEEAPYGLLARLAISTKTNISSASGAKSRSRGASVDPEGENDGHEDGAKAGESHEAYGVLAPTYFIRGEYVLLKKIKI